METSQSIAALAEALSKAQAEMKNPAFDKVNPAFKSQYASYAAIRDEVIPALSKQGIAVVQEITNVDIGVQCVTMFMHSSGEWIRFSPIAFPVSKISPWDYASAGSYAKRQSLQAAAVVVGDTDDDAEAAQKSTRVDPAEVTLSPQQQKAAAYFAKEMAGILAKDIDGDHDENAKAKLALEVHQQVNEDQTVYVAASKLLSAPQRKAWKSLIELGRKA